MKLSRRDALRHVTAMMGGIALVGADRILAGQFGSGNSDSLFTTEEVAWLDEVAETILPETDTPGARAAEVGAFIALMVTDVYDHHDQGTFREGMNTMERLCIERYGTGFMGCKPEQRTAFLVQQDQEQHALTNSENAEGDDQSSHYFRMIKELTLLGYFTSEIGYTKAMRYIEVPGRWDPCVPYTEGERTWARHA